MFSQYFKTLDFMLSSRPLDRVIHNCTEPIELHTILYPIHLRLQVVAVFYFPVTCLSVAAISSSRTVANLNGERAAAVCWLVVCHHQRPAMARPQEFPFSWHYLFMRRRPRSASAWLEEMRVEGTGLGWDWRRLQQQEMLCSFL